MRYIDFFNTFSPLGCLSVNQIKVIQPNFDTTALGRWVGKGYLVQLKNGIYAFRQWLSQPGADFIAGNLMYQPSYVSLYSALAHYGIIPEFVAHTTSITTLKTADFANQLGTFSYRHVKPELFFGYRILDSTSQRKLRIATPEKALIDLLYLTPSLKSAEDVLQLRLDEDYMSEEFDYTEAHKILTRFNSKALTRRFNILEQIYQPS